MPGAEDGDDDGNCGVLCLPPNHIAAMENLQMILPLDWECQAGTIGGVYPCPDGVPSTCRAADVSDACKACFCLHNEHPCCEYVDMSIVALSADVCGGDLTAAVAADAAWIDGPWTCADYRINWPTRCHGDMGAFVDVSTNALAKDTCKSHSTLPDVWCDTLHVD